MTKFSERYGHVPVRSVLQVGDIDIGLRNRLWNEVRDSFFQLAPPWRGARGDILLSGSNADSLFKNVWHNYLKQTVDSIGHSYVDALDKLKEYFMRCQWYEVYDLVEFFSGVPSGLYKQPFIDSVNKILKEEMSGYRFVSGRIVEITSEEEIAAIEQALAVPDSLKPVRDHLNQSLTLLT